MSEPLRRSMRPLASGFIDSLIKAAPGKESWVVREAVAAIEEEARQRGYGEQILMTGERREKLIYRIIGRDAADFRMLSAGEADQRLRQLLQYHQGYDRYSDAALMGLAEFLAITY